MSAQRSALPDSTPRVAPYLTHLVTHHGQLTLIPPQNAGRVRKPQTKKKRQVEGGSRERRPDDEPRFTTGVPPASSRRLNPASAQTRVRRQPPVQPTRAQTDSLLDDIPVPDYPPPSFQEAILSSPSVCALPSPYTASVQSVTPHTSPPTSPHPEPPSPLYDHPHVLHDHQRHSPASLATHAPPSPNPAPSSPCTTSDDPGADSDSSSGELIMLDSSQQWEADRSTGLTLDQRVRREFFRKQAAESSTTVNLLRGPMDSSPHQQDVAHCARLPSPVTRPRRCSHCGSLRPLDGDIHSGDDDGDGIESDESDVDAESKHGLRTSRSKARLKSRHGSLDLRKFDTSPPPSPSSPSPLVSAPGMSPWTSTATLLSSAFSLGKDKEKPLAGSLASPSDLGGQLAKRKEPAGLRRLFAKGKEKGRGREKETQPDSEWGREKEAYAPEVDELESWEEITPSEIETDGRSLTISRSKEQKNRDNDTRKGSPTAEVRLLRARQNPPLLPPPPSAALAFVPRHLRRNPPPAVSPFPITAPAPSAAQGAFPPEKTPFPPLPAGYAGNEPLRAIARRPPQPPPQASQFHARPVRQMHVSSPSAMVWRSDEAPNTHGRQHERSPLSVDATLVGRMSLDISPVTVSSPQNACRDRSGELELPHPARGRRRHTSGHVASAPSAVPTLIVTSPARQIASLDPSYPPPSPTTPPTPTGHHYPGRPLPVPPGSPTASVRMMTPPPAAVEPASSMSSASPTTQQEPADAAAGNDDGRGEWSNYTDLDVFIARIGADEAPDDGRNYEDLLRMSEFIGPAVESRLQSAIESATPISSADSHPLMGRIEVERRRVLTDGRVKLKLTLLGVVVEKCGICLSQFKDEEMAALGPVCQHSFHEKCLRRWLAMKRTCPICRVGLCMDDTASTRTAQTS